MARSSEWMRRLDKSVLAAAAFSVSAMNRGRPLPEAPDRVGIIQPTAIGDTIIASGAVAAIAVRYPEAVVSVFHGPNNAPAVAMIDAGVVSVPCDFSSPGKALATLRQAKLDLVVDMTPWTNLTAVIARLSAPCAVGFAPGGAARGKVFDIAVPHAGNRHEIENLADLAGVFRPRGEPYAMRIRSKKSPLADTLPIDRLVLCQLCAGGSRAAEKAWPLEHWAAFCSKLIDRGYVPAFTGVAGNQATVDQLLAMLGPLAASTHSLCGKLPLAELGDLLARAHAVVSVDTSILHLASAVNARVFGLHGPTRSVRWGSRSSRGQSFDSPHPDAGYIIYGMEQHPRAMDVMKALKPDAVVEAVAKVERRIEHDELAIVES
jgi:ADP-heptose:LPS heptosyltransferase